MIPSSSYPEAMAKARVITLQDQLKCTVNTLHKASTLHVDTSRELISADCTAPEKALIIICCLLTPVYEFLGSAQTSEQADTGSNTKPVYTVPFGEFIPCISVTGAIDSPHEVTI